MKLQLYILLLVLSACSVGRKSDLPSQESMINFTVKDSHVMPSKYGDFIVLNGEVVNHAESNITAYTGQLSYIDQQNNVLRIDTLTDENGVKANATEEKRYMLSLDSSQMDIKIKLDELKVNWVTIKVVLADGERME